MGLGALAHVQRIRKLHREILKWAEQEYQPSCLVPVDSPAANFPLVQGPSTTRRPNGPLGGATVVGLGALAGARSCDVAPTRSCACLPFEPDWFKRRNIPARFVGHPAINRELDEVTQGTPGW